MDKYRTFAYVSISAILLCCVYALIPHSTNFKTTPDTATQALNNAQIERVQAFAKNWPKTPDYTVIFTALPSNNVHSSTEYAAFNATDDYFGLPRKGAYEDVANYCGACHSLQIVMQQRATKPRWDYMLTWMSQKQGMMELPADTRAEVLNYLSENFGP